MEIYKIEYALKGKIGTNFDYYFHISGTPYTPTPEEAQAFYDTHKHDSLFKWERYKDIAVVKIVRIKDEFVHLVADGMNEAIDINDDLDDLKLINS